MDFRAFCVLAVFALVLAGCVGQAVVPTTVPSATPTASPVPTGSGVLEGVVSIGPLCPVEQPSPEPGCRPTQETYDAWRILVWAEGLKQVSEPIRLYPDASKGGYYRILLPAGSYKVDLQERPAVGGSNLPAVVAVREGASSVLDISIDTGIR